MQEELQKLKEEFEERIRGLEIKYKTEGELGIKEGDNYWYVDGRGDIYNKQWEYDLFDGNLFEIGNVFKTKEEASFEIGRLKVLRELEKMGKPFEIDGNNWTFCLNREYDVIFSTNYDYNEKFGSYYFNTEDEAKEAVQKIGADRIKKYLFGVED